MVLHWSLHCVDGWLCHLDVLDRWRRISLCHLDVLWCSVRGWLMVLHWSSIGRLTTISRTRIAVRRLSGEHADRHGVTKKLQRQGHY